MRRRSKTDASDHPAGSAPPDRRRHSDHAVDSGAASPLSRRQTAVPGGGAGRAGRRHQPAHRRDLCHPPSAGLAALARRHSAGETAAAAPRSTWRSTCTAGPRSGWLTWATRAPMRVGYDVSGRRWMYTHRIARPRGYQPRHSVLNQWDLVAPVVGTPGELPSPERDRVEMPVPDASRAAMRGATGIDGRGARRRSRSCCTRARESVPPVAGGVVSLKWPRTLAGDRRDRRVIVLGDRADESLAAEIAGEPARRIRRRGGRILPALGWPLDHVRALMERAALFVGGDSGPMHIAATTDVPIVAIFGPTLPALWTPWRPARLPLAIVEAGPLPCRPCDQRVCQPGDFRCLRNIGPDRVDRRRASAAGESRMTSRAIDARVGRVHPDRAVPGRRPVLVVRRAGGSLLGRRDRLADRRRAGSTEPSATLPSFFLPVARVRRPDARQFRVLERSAGEFHGFATVADVPDGADRRALRARRPRDAGRWTSSSRLARPARSWASCSSRCSATTICRSGPMGRSATG